MDQSAYWINFWLKNWVPMSHFTNKISWLIEQSAYWINFLPVPLLLDYPDRTVLRIELEMLQT